MPAGRAMGRTMGDPSNTRPVLETEPKSQDIRLDERLYEFNVQATGIADGKLLALFLRREDGATVGGIYGWTWGETCYIRYLFIPTEMRNQGHGSSLMHAVEAEARARGCGQIVLQTHDFQAPAFYRSLGFEITGRFRRISARASVPDDGEAPWQRRSAFEQPNAVKRPRSARFACAPRRTGATTPSSCGSRGAPCRSILPPSRRAASSSPSTSAIGRSA